MSNQQTKQRKKNSVDGIKRSSKGSKGRVLLTSPQDTLQRMHQGALSSVSYGELLQLQSAVGNRRMKGILQRNVGAGIVNRPLSTPFAPMPVRQQVNTAVVQRGFFTPKKSKQAPPPPVTTPDDHIAYRGYDEEDDDLELATTVDHKNNDLENRDDVVSSDDIVEPVVNKQDEIQNTPLTTEVSNEKFESDFEEMNFDDFEAEYQLYFSGTTDKYRRLVKRAQERASTGAQMSENELRMLFHYMPTLPIKDIQGYLGASDQVQERFNQLESVMAGYLQNNTVEAFVEKYGDNWQLLWYKDRLTAKIKGGDPVHDHELDFMAKMGTGEQVLELNKHSEQFKQRREQHLAEVVRGNVSRDYAGVANIFLNAATPSALYYMATVGTDYKLNSTRVLEYVREWHESNYANVSNVLPEDQVERIRKKITSSDWSWVLKGDITSLEVSLKMQVHYVASLNTHKAKDDSRLETTLTGVGGASEVASYGLTLHKGIEIINRIKQDADSMGAASAVSEVGRNAAEGTIEWILGQVFGTLLIGKDLIQIFHYQRRRRKWYRKAMDKAQIDTDGQTTLSENNPENLNKIRLGLVAYYAYKKTKRAFRLTIIKAALRIIKWLSHFLSVLSAGATAIVTGPLALAADVMRALIGIGQKVRGFHKWRKGRRGVQRKTQARELLNLALEGDRDAAETIYRVDPFDDFKTTFRKVSSKGSLRRPRSLDHFMKQLKTGKYKDPKKQDQLMVALANTMKSV